MIAHSGPQLVGMLGRSMLDAQVTGMLGELGAATPPLDPDHWQSAAAPAHGLDFVFKPQDQIRAGDCVDATPDDLVFAQLFFHGPGYENYAAYAGTLPYGLTFDMSVAAVRAILDTMATPDPQRAQSWDFEREYVGVQFAAGGKSITRVIVGLPWSGVSHRNRRPEPRVVAAAAFVDRRLAHGREAWERGTPPPGGYPPELVALRREQAERQDPFFTDMDFVGDYVITLTVDPRASHSYLDCAEGAGYERFFADILWLGEDNESGLVGYWKVEAETFIGAPVVRLDNEGVCQVVGPTFVDYYASLIGDHPTLVDFCRRAGLPPPMTEEQRTAAVAGLPDPDLVRDEFVRRARVDGGGLTSA